MGGLYLIDYGIGNVLSIANMLRSASIDAKISAYPGDIRGATRLILAGVGAFDAGMKNLDERRLIPVLEDAVFDKKVPITNLATVHMLTDSIKIIPRQPATEVAPYLFS